MNQKNHKSTSAMSGASPASVLSNSFEPCHEQHQASNDIIRRINCMLLQSGGSVQLGAALELLRKEPMLERVTSTEVLNACLNTRGQLNFHAKEGSVIICRGETPSLQSCTDDESTTTRGKTTPLQSSAKDNPSTAGKPACCDVTVVQPLPDALGEEFFPAVVREVVSPEAVIINLVGRWRHELKALLEMMNLYYSTQGIGGIAGQMYRIQDLVAGALCAYPHVDMPSSKEENWCRGVVTSVLQNCMVRVTDVDSGLKALKPITSLRQLASHFRSLPRQAITVKLCRLRSAQRGVWGPEASARLAELVCGQTVMCRLVNYVKGVPSVVMCDTNGPEDVFVSNVLIEECLALPMSSDDEN